MKNKILSNKKKLYHKFINNELINIKYRDGKKNFKLVKGEEHLKLINFIRIQLNIISAQIVESILITDQEAIQKFMV